MYKANSKWFSCNGLWVIIFFSIWLGPSTTWSQVLGMNTTIKYAIDNYPGLKQWQKVALAAQQHINLVNDSKLPSLTLMNESTLGSSNSLAGGIFTMGLIPSVSGSIGKTNNTTAVMGDVAITELQWDVYNFGYRNSLKKEAEARYSLAGSRSDAYLYLLKESVVSMYLNWLKDYNLIRVEEEHLGRAEAIFLAIRANVMSGLKPGVDSATASSQLSAARVDLIQARNNYLTSGMALSAYINQDLSALLPDTVMYSDANLRALAQNPVANTSLDNGLLKNPLVDAYQKDYELQLAANETVKRKYMPRVTLESAVWMRSSDISPSGTYVQGLDGGFTNKRYNYLMGLGISYDLVNLKKQKDNVAEDRSLAEAKKFAVDEQQLQLKRIAMQVDASYRSVLMKLQELPVQLQAAAMAYEQQKALFKSGLNTMPDVTNALFQLKNAESSMVQSRIDLLKLIYMKAELNNSADTFLNNFK